ncbi:hypothetical protein Q7A53_06295 [Halobacillus rhizosphaerae]|uniref:hypothetical protein n=1 Tax=Halobacillus rhizosphaerae TaxID=3064889 RepID=UPI00398A7488
MSYLATFSGRKFDYFDIKKESIHIDDIFRALPRLNRFVGHSSRAYSVGEHSINCVFMAEALGYSPREQFLVFMHDFVEVYMCDCPSPLKNLLPDFVKIEEQVEAVIYEYFNIEPPTQEEKAKIKKVDWTMLVIEMRDLTMHEHESFINDNTHVEILEKSKITQPQQMVSEEEIRDQLYAVLYYFGIHYGIGKPYNG